MCNGAPKPAATLFILIQPMPTDPRSLRRPFHLLLDWDGTLTKKDTLSIVGQIAYQQHTRSKRNDPPTLRPWAELVNAYMDDFTAHQKDYRPQTKARRAIQEERDWLSSLAPIENKSVRRVEDSGLFRGVTSKDVVLTAREAVESGELQLRTGWLDLFRKTKGTSEPDAVSSDQAETPDDVSTLSILSVNWSEHFIRSALREADSKHQEKSSWRLDSYVQSMTILANEISGLDSVDGGSGKLTKNDSAGIRTSADKLNHLPERCQQRLDHPETRAHPLEANEHFIIYVGDSATDTECLLAADVGICIRDEPMGSGQRELAETLERLGVTVLHVSQDINLDRDYSAIYWASNLQEISDILPSA